MMATAIALPPGSGLTSAVCSALSLSRASVLRHRAALTAPPPLRKARPPSSRALPERERDQVLHHLPDEPSKGWPLTRKVIGELARVLRPGGVLVVNFCSHEQLRRGWWFFPLIEPAAERMIARHALLLELESMIVASGFELCGRFVPTDAVIQGQSYYDPRGPLDATWRAGDSVWAMLSPEEVEAVEERVRDMDARGELENFVAHHDSDRLNVGQTTFLCARRR